MVLGYFSWGKSSQPEPELSPVRALPASWYKSEEMYQLERRAIFSRRWMIITHKCRLQKPGDFLRFDVANFDFIVLKDRENQINAFHNVCRHRAYPVVEKDEGNAKILACKYHGWSYGLSGKLAKAPQYQDLPNFDKSRNGLFPIHTRIDKNGFIWINLDSNPTPELSWEEEFDQVDRQKRYEEFNFDEYHYDHTWDITANYNWKIAADNYNECYHCPTTHPDIKDIANLESYDVYTKASHIQHDPATTEEQRAKGLNVAATYLYPNASMTVTPHFFYIQRFSPGSATTTHITYQVFRHTPSSDEDFDRIDQAYKRVMNEDKVLCNRAQKNLNAGVFVNGEMHPKLEKGPLYFQKITREIITEHHKREQAAKREIWPAQQSLPSDANVSQADIDFCAGLACSTPPEQLSW